MLWTIIVILIVLWLLGFIGHVGGSLIHLLLLIAVVVLIITSFEVDEDFNRPFFLNRDCCTRYTAWMVGSIMATAEASPSD